ncbi:MAG: hypothetical protein IT434_05250 [Phycisphaerales bacterium]|jgi:hypothetical protein|nr:hypothetical protein [Phycisphaerales bacterium]
MSTFDQIAAVHAEFSGLRDRLYSAIGRSNFPLAAKLSADLAGVFGRYQSLCAEAAKSAREEAAKSKFRHPKRVRDEHLAAVAHDPEKVFELLQREAIEAGEEGNE